MTTDRNWMTSAILCSLLAISAAESAVPKSEDGAGSTGRLRVTLSIDWEGRNLLAANLDAIERFRERYPAVPLTHFICAAYLTKPGADPDDLEAAIGRASRDGDEIGLHIHPWRSLVEAARVPFRGEPTFWGEHHPPVEDEHGDIGHEVELTAYEGDEIRKIVQTSRALLAEVGIELGTSFRAGGWLASPEVLAAVRAEGYLVDSSATDATWHDEVEGLRLQARIAELWPDVTRESQPYSIETPAGQVLELVDTGALADYLTAAEMIAHVHGALERLAAAPEHDVHVHLGFHQETAARCSSRVDEALEAVLADPAARALIVFETASSAAAQADVCDAETDDDTAPETTSPRER